MFMVATRDGKLVHCEGGLPPMHFDLKNDPNELIGLGISPEHSDVGLIRMHCSMPGR